MVRPIAEQAVKMRDLAQVMRHHARETANREFISKFERTAVDLEEEAERVERAARCGRRIGS